jgi:YHS domain-containing protein
MRVVLILVALLLLVIVLRSLLRDWQRPRIADPRRHDELVKDPVCQTYVVMSRAVRREVNGVTTYFCGPECARRYLREKQGA